MFWLIFLALMLLVPLLAGVHTWRELRREGASQTEAAPVLRARPIVDSLSTPETGNIRL